MSYNTAGFTILEAATRHNISLEHLMWTSMTNMLLKNFSIHVTGQSLEGSSDD
jgi:hypothetical protein